MKNLLLGLTSIGMILTSTIFPNLIFAQSTTTPSLNSIGLPFNIDGYVERQSSTAGDWSRGSQTNGNDSGYLIYDNGVAKAYELNFHTTDAWGNSSNDDVFSGGAKFNEDPTTWSWGTGSVPAKNDVNNTNIHIAEATTGDLWAVVAADRASVNGTSYLDFEFLQEKLEAVAPSGSSSGSFTTAATDCGRTVGDILITVEYTNGGVVDSIYFYRWVADAGASCGYDWQAFTIPSGNAFGVSSNGTVDVPYGAFGDTTYTTKQFVEIAINLTEVINGSIVADPCTSLFFETMFLKTKASSSPTATLKDLTQPYQLELNVGQAMIDYGSLLCAGASYSATNNGPSHTDGGTFTLLSPNNGHVTVNSSTGELSAGANANGTYLVEYTYSPRTGCTQYDTATVVIGNAVTGNIFNDADGLCHNTLVSGTGIGSADGNQLYTVLVNGSDEVVAVTSVDGSGSYDLGCHLAGTYTAIVMTSAPSIGSTGNSAGLPTNWAFTGENIGAAAGDDGSPNGSLTITITNTDISNANFGINKRPETSGGDFQIAKPVYGGTVTVGFGHGFGTTDDFASTDNEDGNQNATLDSITITGLALNDSNELYYNGTHITAAMLPYTINNFDQSLMSFEVYADDEVQVSYTITDNACLTDETPATLRYWWIGQVPVEFVNVKAKGLDNGNVLVEWSTATEVNNELFEVERMVNGEEFTKIGEVLGAGNSVSILKYGFLDANAPQSGNVYYRIKQIDFDGQYSYSNVVAVEMESELDVIVYPNPTRGNFVVKTTESDDEITVELIDMKGTIISTWNGVGSCEATTNEVRAGLYTLRISSKYSAKTMLLQVD